MLHKGKAATKRTVASRTFEYERINVGFTSDSDGVYSLVLAVEAGSVSVAASVGVDKFLPDSDMATQAPEGSNHCGSGGFSRRHCRASRLKRLCKSRMEISG